PAGFTGSLVVAEFDSLEAAQAWAELTRTSKLVFTKVL
ncbi:hypothetical protein MGSAQ_000824, partial [marine sediment metagenome]